jgi:hypothetical protein
MTESSKTLLVDDQVEVHGLYLTYLQNTSLGDVDIRDRSLFEKTP